MIISIQFGKISRPIAENEPRMTLLCAAAVNLNGGRTPDGGCMIGESVFYANQDDKTENTMSLGQFSVIVIYLFTYTLFYYLRFTLIQ